MSYEQRAPTLTRYIRVATFLPIGGKSSERDLSPGKRESPEKAPTLVTMTVQIANGSVVEDTYNAVSDASPVTEAYVLVRVLKDLAYSARDVSDANDDDLEQWASLLSSVELGGHSLGAIQAKATDFTTADYLEQTGLNNAVMTVQPSDEEQRIIRKGNLKSFMSDENATLLTEYGVPTTPDGEAVPALVASNEQNEGLHTFEEAKELLESFLSHVPLDVSDGDVSTTDDTEQSTDSDEEDHLMNEVDKVGPATAENIREFLVNNRQSLDWRDHIDAEAWSNAPTIVTEEEARERLQNVASEMPTGTFGVASDMISEGNTSQAIEMIADFE